MGGAGQDPTKGLLIRVQWLCDGVTGGVTWPKSYSGKINLGAAGRMDGKERDQRVGSLLEDSNSGENFIWGGSSMNRKQVNRASNISVIKSPDFK